MTFGERIKTLRQSKGMTQSEVAKLLNIDRSTYGKYETGDSSPDYEKLVKISELFSATTDFLLGKTRDKNNVVREVTVDGKIAQVEMIKSMMPENITDEELIGYVKMAIKLKNAGLKLDDK